MRFFFFRGRKAQWEGLKWCYKSLGSSHCKKVWNFLRFCWYRTCEGNVGFTFPVGILHFKNPWVRKCHMSGTFPFMLEMSHFLGISNTSKKGLLFRQIYCSSARNNSPFGCFRDHACLQASTFPSIKLWWHMLCAHVINIIYQQFYNYTCSIF